MMGYSLFMNVSVRVVDCWVKDEVVDFGGFLNRGWPTEEFFVLSGVWLAVIELVDFLFAVEDMGVTLEHALSDIIEDGETEGIYFHSALI